MSAAPAVPRLAILNDYEVVVAGIAAMLDEKRDRVRVVELDLDQPHAGSVDVILYDTFGHQHSSMDHLEALVRRSQVPVVVYTWRLDDELAREALARGASGYLSKQLGGAAIADAVRAVLDGKIVVSPERELTDEQVAGEWPGRDDVGLSARESEVLTMIARGLSNQEIAERSYLSINSVKTYVRGAYRKIHVDTRSQAVIWAIGHGLVPHEDTSAPTEPPNQPPAPA